MSLIIQKNLGKTTSIMDLADIFYQDAPQKAIELYVPEPGQGGHEAIGDLYNSIKPELI